MHVFDVMIGEVRVAGGEVVLSHRGTDLLGSLMGADVSDLELSFRAGQFIRLNAIVFNFFNFLPDGPFDGGGVFRIELAHDIE